MPDTVTIAMWVLAVVGAVTLVGSAVSHVRRARSVARRLTGASATRRDTVAGNGYLLKSLGEDDLAECDWGHCSRESVATRMDDDEGGWLAVCAWHAGWEDYPS